MPDLRLALPAVVLWIACAVLIGVPQFASVVAILTAVAAAGTLAGLGIVSIATRRRPRASFLPLIATLLAAVALGSAIVAAQAPGRLSADLDAAADQSEQVQVLVRVERAPQRRGSGFGGDAQWALRGRTVGDSASIPVSVRFAGSEQEARGDALGAVLRISGAVQRNEPGEATGYTIRAGGRNAVALVESPPPWLSWAAAVRTDFAAAAATTAGDGGALLPGLAIGDETAVSEELDAAMKASSLSHLTAVSGANCALVIALVFALARLVGFGRRARVGAAALALLGFVALVGPGASVIRAAAMAAVLLIGLARGRPSDGVPALALALVVLVIHDPWLARDYGFALSALATAGLLVLAGPLSRMFARWMPRSLALAVAVPTAAQLACQPVLILLTPTVPLLGIPANLLAEPAAPLATVLGCLACAVLPWAPGLGDAIVRLAWIPSAWIAQVASFSSSLPGVALPWAPGLLGVLLSSAILVAVAVLVLARGAPRAVSATAIVALCAGAVVYVGALGGGVVGRALAIPADWQIAACDVGQGDGLLLRDGDAVGMIDVGRKPEPAAACLDRLGITRLDFLLLTHFDADHVGGVAGVASRAQRAIVQRPVRDADERTLGILRSAGVPIEQGRAGLSGRLGELTWRLLWPPGPGETPAGMDTGNAGSLTVEAEGRGIRSIFLGDLGEEAQDALLARRTVRPVDLVKVAHHGSADQSPALYRALGARLGLISVGVHNGYGHPTGRALQLLTDDGTAMARTDEQGLLLVSPGSPGMRLWSDRQAADTAGGRLYPGYERGGTWRPEAAAEAVRQRPAPPQAQFRRFPGTRCARHPWFSSPGVKRSSPSGRSGPCGTPSRPLIPASRSATCTPATTHPASCSPSRAPPCSTSRGSSASRPSRSATMRSSPTCSATWKNRPTAPSSPSGTAAVCAARSCSTRSGPVRAAESRWCAPN